MSASGTSNRFQKVCAAFAAAVVLWTVSPHAQGADQAQIQQAVARSAGYLRGKVGSASGGERSLLSYALLKAGLPHNSPEVQGAVTAIRGKVTDGVYKPVSQHLYEAGVDGMLLVEAPGELEEGQEHPYRAELEAIAAYIVSSQLSNGGWDYPPGQRNNTTGDTSVIQYALLGLWAARRAGVEVTPTVWQNSIQWHIANQEADGGFAYCPGTRHGFGEGSSVLNMTINAIGSTYISLMQISPGEPPELKNPKIAKAVDEAPKETRKFGVLEKVDLDKLPSRDAPAAQPRAKVPAETAELLSRAYNWILPRFVADNSTTGFRSYYFYSLERMGALANVNQIGDNDWFNDCADFLLKQQQTGGSWKLSSHTDERVDTAFAVLFLTRSTAKILKRTIPVDPIGGGLLSGGRGGLDGSREPGTKKPLGPLDELLASLDSAGDLEVADVQEQFVEQIQIGDRDALIGQTDLLIRYMQHVNPEIRRTAVWALGRTDNLSLGRYLIDALSDQDLSVVVEARNALCWLSRRPNGFGEAADPLEALPPDATEEQQGAAAIAWRVELLKKWGRWYLQNRPYADRGDDFEAELLQKLAAIS